MVIPSSIYTIKQKPMIAMVPCRKYMFISQLEKHFFLYELYDICKLSKNSLSNVLYSQRVNLKTWCDFPLACIARPKRAIWAQCDGCSPAFVPEGQGKKRLHLMKWKTKVLSGLFLPRNKRGSSVHCVNEYRPGKETPSRLNLKPYTGLVPSIQFFLHWENNSEIQCRWD